MLNLTVRPTGEAMVPTSRDEISSSVDPPRQLWPMAPLAIGPGQAKETPAFIKAPNRSQYPVAVRREHCDIFAFGRLYCKATGARRAKFGGAKPSVFENWFSGTTVAPIPRRRVPRDAATAKLPNSKPLVRRDRR
jgi:hypothetical protein